MLVLRGDIFYADLGSGVGSEQGGRRPVLITQNDTGNKFSPTVITAAITSSKTKNKLPTHIDLSEINCGLPKDSIVMLEQIRTIDKKRLGEKVGHINLDEMEIINDSLQVSFGLLPIAEFYRRKQAKQSVCFA